MKMTKFTEAQIVFALRQADTGVTVAEVCRKMDISEATYYNWKKKYGGLGVPELRRFKQLEEKNQHLKQLVADLSLDKQLLQDVLKKVLKPVQRRHAAQHLIDAYRLSARRACRVLNLQRACFAYQAYGRDDTVLRQRLRLPSPSAGSLWQSAPLYSAASRGLAGQSQACTPTLLSRRLELTQQTPQT
jgi:putative transposase